MNDDNVITIEIFNNKTNIAISTSTSTKNERPSYKNRKLKKYLED